MPRDRTSVRLAIRSFPSSERSWSFERLGFVEEAGTPKPAGDARVWPPRARFETAPEPRPPQTTAFRARWKTSAGSDPEGRALRPRVERALIPPRPPWDGVSVAHARVVRPRHGHGVPPRTKAVQDIGGRSRLDRDRPGFRIDQPPWPVDGGLDVLVVVDD